MKDFNGIEIYNRVVGLQEKDEPFYKFAIRINTSVNTIKDWKRGYRVPSFDKLKELSNLLEVSFNWLAFGIGPQRIDLQDETTYTVLRELDVLGDIEDLVSIPKISVRLADETGELVYLYIEKAYQFYKSWLVEAGLNPEHLVVVEVYDSSMEPALFRGDTVLIDIHKKDIIKGKMFAVGIDNVLKIRSLMKRSNGTVEIEQYGLDPLVEEYRLDDLIIIGQVVWLGRVLV